MKKILVTGCAGFIGYHLCIRLIEESKYEVVGIDNINDYYDVQLKKNRLKNLKKYKTKFNFKKIDLINEKELIRIFSKNKFDYVVNLAAQAGVRYSIENPKTYLMSNVLGFFNILDVSQKYKIKHLIFASTSSVYGSSKTFPLKESYNTDNPLSFYAATKKSNEVMAYSYSNIFKLPCTGLRFFTVYGPYGRPDMSLFKFTNSLTRNEPIELYNKGDHIRDFTYIDDVVDGIYSLIKKPSKAKIPYNIFNIGSDNPKHLKKFLRIIENNLDKKAKIIKKSLQTGDVYKTHASIRKLKLFAGYSPKISLNKGIKEFILWYKSYIQKNDF